MNRCEYCGDPADSKDHLYPRAWTGARAGALEGRGPWVWACRDCNNRLSDIGLYTVDERTAWVKAALRKKHAKLLALGWPDGHDFDELGPGLKQYRVRRCIKYANITSRLAYPYRADWERDPEKVRQLTAWANLAV